MAGESVTTKSSVIAPTGINTAITPTTFTDSGTKDNKIQSATLTQIQNALTKLSTYATKVNNCKTIYTYTVLSTSCQSTTTNYVNGYTYRCQTTKYNIVSTTCQTNGYRYACQSVAYVVKGTGCQSCQKECYYTSTTVYGYS